MLELITPISVFEEFRFVFELLIGELIFVLPYFKRRKNFKVVFPLSTAFILAYSFVYFVILFLVKNHNISPNIYRFAILAHYIVLTIISTFIMYLSFEIKFSLSILFTSLGYAIQHIEFAVVNESLAIGLLPQIKENVPLYILICVASYALYIFAFYMLLVRKVKSLGKIDFQGSRNVPILFFIMLIFVIFLTFGGQTVFQNGSLSQALNNPNYLGVGLEIISSILVIIVSFLLFHINKVINEKAIIDQLLNENKHQYELKKTSISAINQKCHDLKHQIRALKEMGGVEKDEMLTQLEQDVLIYDTRIETDNEALNTIMMEKNLLCLSKNIRMSFMGNGKNLSRLNTIDIYTLFGNAIDNAIEAVIGLEEKFRSIDIFLEAVGDKTKITISNYFSGEINKDGDKILTIKENKEYHGFGLASMQNIAEKYSGTFKVEVEDNIFTLSIDV